jgi:NTE family protein
MAQIAPTLKGPEPEPPSEPSDLPVDEAAARRSGLALCLSGGGYRAALFHLGAARRLHELKILNRIDTVSSVSGGSIFAAVLADRAIRSGWDEGLAVEDFEHEVAEPMRALVGHDLRTLPFLLHLPWNWILPGPRARHLEGLLAHHVSSARLGELPKKPRFVLCATDLTFGVNWESSRERTGSWQAGYLADGGDWPLARAVAASACFPPIFGPLPVGSPLDRFRRRRGDPGLKLHRRLALSDGGVYDNMGLEPVWKTHACLLVSDGGAPVECQASRNPLRRLLRYTSVVMNQAQSLRRRMFFGGIDRRSYTGTRWDLRTTTSAGGPGYSDEIVTGTIARIRTDLDRFTEAEQMVLENHGYCAVETRFREKLSKEIPDDATDAQVPHPEWMDEDRVRHSLRRSHARISLERLVARS